jgi:monoamine oxidase
MIYDDFEDKLRDGDKQLLALFPKLKWSEKGKTCDDLFEDALRPVLRDYWDGYAEHAEVSAPRDEKGDIRAWEKIITKYDKYTLCSYLREVAQWIEDALRLYELGNAHVVFDNGFIESLKDAFLSSNRRGTKSGIKQLQNVMDEVPKAFLTPTRGKWRFTPQRYYFRGARRMDRP